MHGCTPTKRGTLVGTSCDSLSCASPAPPAHHLQASRLTSSVLIVQLAVAAVLCTSCHCCCCRLSPTSIAAAAAAAGYFEREEDAGRAWDLAALNYWGEAPEALSRLNFQSSLALFRQQQQQKEAAAAAAAAAPASAAAPSAVVPVAEPQYKGVARVRVCVVCVVGTLAAAGSLNCRGGVAPAALCCMA